MLIDVIRLLHYPPCPTSEFKQNERRVRAGAHTDYGKPSFHLTLTSSPS